MRRDNCSDGHFKDDLWQYKERTVSFPTAYKIKAIKRVERGDGVLPVALELGISRKILHNWIKAWKVDGSDGLNRKRGPKPGITVTALDCTP